MPPRTLTRKRTPRPPYPSFTLRDRLVGADRDACPYSWDRHADVGVMVGSTLYDGQFLLARAETVAALLAGAAPQTADGYAGRFYFADPAAAFDPRPAAAVGRLFDAVDERSGRVSDYLSWTPLTRLWAEGFREADPPQWYRATPGPEMHAALNGLRGWPTPRGATLLTVSFNRPGWDAVVAAPARLQGEYADGRLHSLMCVNALVGRRAWPRLVGWLDWVRRLPRRRAEAAVLSRFGRHLEDRYHTHDENHHLRLDAPLRLTPLSVTVLLPGAGRPGVVQFDRADASPNCWSEPHYGSFDRVPPLQRLVRPVLSRPLKDVVADPLGAWKAAELATLL